MKIVTIAIALIAVAMYIKADYLQTLLTQQRKTSQKVQKTIARYEKLLNHIFQGEWDANKAVDVRFIDEWQGKPVYSYKLVNRKPGDRYIDAGEVIDRKLQGD